MRYLLTLLFACGGALLLSASTALAELTTLTRAQQQHVLASFPSATHIGALDETTHAWPVLKNTEQLGYVIETNQFVDIPAYSGKPINLLVSIGLDAHYRNAWVIEHHEPILLVGIPESKLNAFTDQYIGKSIKSQIKVGGKPSETHINAVTGATVTVLVVNETILKATRKFAITLGMIKPSIAELQPPSHVKPDVFNTENWQALISDGTIRTLKLNRGKIDTAFMGTEAENINKARAEETEDTFIELFYTYLNAPTSGKNLLGESEYQWLMSELKPGEHAIAILGNGYSFKGSGYVRGGIFDRISISQNNNNISFHDVDHHRLFDIYPEGVPKFKEMAIFIIRAQHAFDPGTNWDLNLLINRQTGPINSVFTTFTAGYQIPERYIDRPPHVEPTPDLPLWVSVWYGKMFQIIVLSISLLLLTAVIFMQSWLVKYPGFLHTLRRIFLVYTVVFIGWYTLGQLSIVNVFTFIHALADNFHWELFLIDPMIFIIWAFAAATILLWGRGIFCGWLCPFGALQELINELARKLKIKQIDVPFYLHEKLWTIKYLILLGLFAVSLESLSAAEKLAEIEPFKTTFLLSFQREWWYVAYALILLTASIFTRKIYCRYLCPLGAALAIPSKIMMFDWLKRRPECGTPCQVCANECEIQAIHPEGKINLNECHYCLDCQVTYVNDAKCPPLVLKHKKRKKREKMLANVQEIPVTDITTPGSTQ